MDAFLESEPLQQSDHEKAWGEMSKEIDNTGDKLGMPIDENVKEAVIALNLLGIPTTASCEGHIDHGRSAPWVEIASPNEPDQRFQGQQDIYNRVAQEYGIILEDVRRANPFEAWSQAFLEASKHAETDEYRNWRESNRKLVAKTQGLLDEFYKGKETQSSTQLTIDTETGDPFRVFNGGEDYK